MSSSRDSAVCCSEQVKSDLFLLTSYVNVQQIFFFQHLQILKKARIRNKDTN
jgi:hypothetical protein